MFHVKHYSDTTRSIVLNACFSLNITAATITTIVPKIAIKISNCIANAMLVFDNQPVTIGTVNVAIEPNIK